MMSKEAVFDMAEILVVDDSEVDLALVGQVLEQFSDWNPEFLTDGNQAARRLRQKEFDLVLTDLLMPSMTGLDLLAFIRDQYTNLPVVIMTGQGNEENVIEALRRGAANYVTKRKLTSELPEIIDSVLQLSRSAAAEARLLSHVDNAEFRFKIPNDQSLVQAAIEFVQNSVKQFGSVSTSELTRLGVALGEALSNAMIHGNLEVSSVLREDCSGRYEELINLRRRQSPYCDRRIFISVKITPHCVDCVIRDEGPGFNVSAVPDPTDVENVARPSGRGLLLIRSLVDEIRHNPEGNQITLAMNLSRPLTQQISMEIDAELFVREISCPTDILH